MTVVLLPLCPDGNDRLVPPALLLFPLDRGSRWPRFLLLLFCEGAAYMGWSDGLAIISPAGPAGSTSADASASDERPPDGA